jgi:hypothetical protein
MLLVMRRDSTEEQRQAVKEYLVERDFDFHQSTGANRVIIGVIGDTARLDIDELRRLPGVLAAFKIPEE